MQRPDPFQGCTLLKLDRPSNWYFEGIELFVFCSRDPHNEYKVSLIRFTAELEHRGHECPRACPTVIGPLTLWRIYISVATVAPHIDHFSIFCFRFAPPLLSVLSESDANWERFLRFKNYAETLHKFRFRIASSSLAIPVEARDSLVLKQRCPHRCRT
jgi:hypothetical protein